MLRIYLVGALCLLLFGCSSGNEAEPPAEHGGHQEEGMFEGEANEQHSNDGLLMDSREEIDGEEDRISTTEAEDIVREHLKINANSNTIVAYDSELEDGRYVIQVNTVHDETTRDNSDDHDGFYTVDAMTGDVQEYRK